MKAAPKGPGVKAEKPKEIKMPPGLLCYICG